MSRSTPSTAILLGLLGLLGFVGCGLIAMVEDPTTSGQDLKAPIAYAAVMLSFIGAVHWGLALGAGIATRRVQRLRYTLGRPARPDRLGGAAAAPIRAALDVAGPTNRWLHRRHGGGGPVGTSRLHAGPLHGAALAGHGCGGRDARVCVGHPPSTASQ